MSEERRAVAQTGDHILPRFRMGQDDELGKERYHLNWVLKAEKLSKTLTR